MTYSPLELAAAFIQTGELQDALDALTQQLETNAHDQEALRLRAEVLARMPERWHDALTDLAAIDSPTPDDFTRRSVLYERMDNLQVASETMEAALAAYPGNERLLERQIYLLQKQGNFKAAIAILSHQPRTWRWLQWLGDTAAQSDDHTLAIQSYTAALDLLEEHHHDPNMNPIRARLLLARADSFQRKNQLGYADSDYLNAAGLIPNDPVILFNRGLITARQGDKEKAAELCREALEQTNDTLRKKLLMELKTHYPALAIVLNRQS